MNKNKVFRLKLIAFFLVLTVFTAYCICITNGVFVSAATTWTDPTTNITYQYTVDENGNASNLCIVEADNLPSEYTIPATVDGYTVVSVSRYDDTTNFFGDSDFSSVTTINSTNTLHSITDKAFSFCSNVTSITLNNVENIGD